jgi:PAS domain S-box-containing protein
MDVIREQFCKSLRRWFEEEYAGDRSQLAAELGVSYEQICNILNARRCGDETWRRKTAAYVGIPYEQMIGFNDRAVAGGNESETAAPSRSVELLPGWLRQILPQLRYLDRPQRDKLSAWLEFEGLGPPSRGRMSPAGPEGGDQAGRVQKRRQPTEPARVHSLEAFRHQFPRLPNTRAAVVVHDGQVILAANAAMCQLAGVADKEIIGTLLLDWLAPGDHQSILTRISRRDTSPYETKLLSRDQGELPVKVTMVRLANWRGSQVRVVSMRQLSGAARKKEPVANGLARTGTGHSLG